MPRRLAVVLTLSAGLAAAACGGSSGGTNAAAGKPGTLPRIVSPTDPTRFDLQIALRPQGSSQGAGLLGSPITITAKGVSVAATSAGDLSAHAVVGAATIDVGVRSDGKAQWLSLGGQWYAFGAASGAGSALGALRPAALQSDISSIGRYATDVRDLGDADVGGVATAHVSANLDITRLRAALATAAKTVQASQAGALLPLQAIAAGLKTGHFELWVGKADSLLRRAKIWLTADTSGPQGVQGLQGLGMEIDLGAAPAPAPAIVAPAGARPSSELQSALLQNFGPILSGAG